MQASLVATKRETRGKNEARRLRVAGHIPAVVYGGSAKESVSVSVDPKKNTSNSLFRLWNEYIDRS